MLSVRFASCQGLSDRQGAPSEGRRGESERFGFSFQAATAIGRENDWEMAGFAGWGVRNEKQKSTMTGMMDANAEGPQGKRARMTHKNMP